jgi:serine/threonine-protein phosphatase 2B catalytic subunit
VPFLAEKVTNMLLNIIKRGAGEIEEEKINIEIEKILKNDEIDDKKKRQLIMKNKVSSIAKMTKMFSTLREESEMLLQIKNISPDGKLPRGILMQGKPAIKNGKIAINYILIVLK